MDDAIRLEPMSPEWVDGVYAIEVASFSLPWSKESLLEEAQGLSGAHYLIARRGQDVLGYGGFRQVLDEAHITNIAVAPAYRKQGIGRQLMNALMELCPHLGILYMTLEVRISNQAALRLYEQCGFTAAGVRPGYYEKPREDAVIMWKTFI
jgi:ribosomal-protein-alanine N-acetyltransferase